MLDFRSFTVVIIVFKTKNLRTASFLAYMVIVFSWHLKVVFTQLSFKETCFEKGKGVHDYCMAAYSNLLKYSSLYFLKSYVSILVRCPFKKCFYFFIQQYSICTLFSLFSFTAAAPAHTKPNTETRWCHRVGKNTFVKHF